MSNRNPEKTADLVIQALQMCDQRAVVASGWGGLANANMPDRVFMIDSVPHAWLFPRVAAVVHHGGVGTTAAGFRAGVPSIVIPFFGDQPFWGKQVARLGVGTEPIPRRKLTAEGLARAIHEVMGNPEMQRRAADLGTKIRAEEGISNAVEVIQQVEVDFLRSNGVIPLDDPLVRG